MNDCVGHAEPLGGNIPPMLRHFTLRWHRVDPKMKTPGGLAGGIGSNCGFLLSAIQPDASCLLFGRRYICAYRAIEELIVFEIDLKKGRPRLDLSGDESLRQRILNVTL